MTPETQAPRKRALLYGGIAAVFALAAVLAAVLLVDVAEKKQEGKNPVVRVVELTDDDRGPGGLGQELPARSTTSTSGPSTWSAPSTAAPRPCRAPPSAGRSPLRGRAVQDSTRTRA